MVKIIDTIDVQHTRLARAQAVGESLQGFDPPPRKEEEAALLQKADAVLAIQHEEQRELGPMVPESPVLLVGHASELVQTKTPDRSQSLLFIGSNYAPNNHGISLFLTLAWPRIRDACPDATLDICGSVCEVLAEYEKTPGIRLHGLVSRLDSFYKNAAMVINPSQFGTGLKIKSVEALSRGKCLVSTEQGVLGLPSAVHEAAYVVPIERMAETASSVLNNPHLRKEAENKAYQFAHTYFSPHVVYRELAAYLQQRLFTAYRHNARIRRPIP